MAVVACIKLRSEERETEVGLYLHRVGLAAHVRSSVETVYGLQHLITRQRMHQLRTMTLGDIR